MGVLMNWEQKQCFFSLWVGVKLMQEYYLKALKVELQG